MQIPIPRFIFIPVLLVFPKIHAEIVPDIYSLFSLREVVHFQASPHHRDQRFTNVQDSQTDAVPAGSGAGSASSVTKSSSHSSEGQRTEPLTVNGNAQNTSEKYQKTHVEQSVDRSSHDQSRSAGGSSNVQAAEAAAEGLTGEVTGSMAAGPDAHASGGRAAGGDSGESKVSTLGESARGAGSLATPQNPQVGAPNRGGRAGKRTAAEPVGQGLRMPALVEETGYPVETHHAATKDGYILALHRVRKKNFAMQSPRVALLWHGLLGSSADWVLNGPEHGLAYLLANDDIDVWMGNARGNIYSKNHTKLDPQSEQFWNFSMHEIGKYDVMASIDYVMKITMASKIFAITHSTGVAGFLIALNEKGIYQNKIHGLVAMAPVTSIKYTSSKLMNLLMSSYGLLKPDLLEFFIGKTYLDTPKLLGESLADTFCEGEIAAPYCGNPLFMLTGFPDKPLKPSPELINANTPAGTSKKLLIHLAQMGLSGQFQNYDLGEDQNQEVYGFSWAPDYIIDKLMTRVIFFSSKDDMFVSDQDVGQLSRQIARLQAKIKVKRPNFRHTDFLWGQDVREQVYERLLREINGLVGH